MKIENRSSKNCVSVSGVLAVALLVLAPVESRAEIGCVVDQDRMCRLENGFQGQTFEQKNPQVHPDRYAQMHGGCDGEGPMGHDGDSGCRHGRGPHHQGRHGMHGRHGMQGQGGGDAAGQCPQERNTAQAPQSYLEMKNPLPNVPEQVQMGRLMFQGEAQPVCTTCHGPQGDGAGPMGMGLVPPPRNFTCAETMNAIPDGQLFWIIKNGSEGTGMPAFGQLPDESIWQIILYLRQFAGK